jgi:IS30 family transposase
MSYSHVTRDQRNVICALRLANLSLRVIAERVGVSASTVCRELKRNASPEGYDVDFADNAAKERQAKARRVPKKMLGDLKQMVIGALERGWSPEELCGRLKVEAVPVTVSCETVYRFIRKDRMQGGSLYKYLRHKGNPYRYKAKKQAGVSLIPNRVDISERPAIVEEKARVGDWEGDTVISAGSKSAVVTLVDRCSKYVCMEKLGRRMAQRTGVAIVDLLEGMPVHTITLDNGLEFAEHEKMGKALGAKVFFAHPYRSCERGLNEHTNGLIREYLPKHDDFRDVSVAKIKQIERMLNTRPRKVLGYLTPEERLFSCRGRCAKAWFWCGEICYKITVGGWY